MHRPARCPGEVLQSAGATRYLKAGSAVFRSGTPSLSAILTSSAKDFACIFRMT